MAKNNGNRVSSYYQLTSDILLEVIHVKLNSPSTIGDSSLGYDAPEFTGYLHDVVDKGNLGLMYDDYNKSKYLFELNKEKDEYDKITNYYKTNNFYVNNIFPINNAESVYVNADIIPNSTGHEGYNDLNPKKMTPTNKLKLNVSGLKDDEAEVIYDIYKLHFTGNNYFGSGNGMVLNTFIYDSKQNKINLSSIIFTPLDTVNFETTPLLVGEKLYTTYYQFRVPSTEWILDSEYSYKFANLLSEYGFQEKTPVNFALKEIHSSYNRGGFTFYNTEEITKITIPYKDGYEDISLDMKEADDGEYFKIRVDAGSESFSDFLRELEGSHSIVHDISLTEYYIDNDNKVQKKQTHRQYYAVNIDDTDENIEDNLFDDPILYRPILQTKNIYYFVISDTLRIINNSDNTTIVKTGRLQYGNKTDENVNKYGKKMLPIVDMTGQIIQANVYNKRTDKDLDSVIIGGGGSKIDLNNQKIENHQYNITSFIETSNVSISVNTVVPDE